MSDEVQVTPELLADIEQTARHNQRDNTYRPSWIAPRPAVVLALVSHIREMEKRLEEMRIEATESARIAMEHDE